MTAAAQDNVAPEFIEGAEAIADYLKSKGFRGMTARRVYRLKESDGWPIVRVPGIGMSAKAPALDAYLDDLFRRNSGGTNGHGQEAHLGDKDRPLRSVGR